jgi:hypothetical protein
MLVKLVSCREVLSKFGGVSDRLLRKYLDRRERKSKEAEKKLHNDSLAFPPFAKYYYGDQTQSLWRLGHMSCIREKQPTHKIPNAVHKGRRQFGRLRHR